MPLFINFRGVTPSLFCVKFKNLCIMVVVFLIMVIVAIFSVIKGVKEFCKPRVERDIFSGVMACFAVPVFVVGLIIQWV